jgi:large subunit ribosomal protein L6
MSRVGKKPIPIPDGVTLKQEGDLVRAKGPLGELSTRMLPGFLLRMDDDGVAHVEKRLTDRRADAMHGVSRAMVANIVEGVSSGFKRNLEVVGTGYRVSLEGRKLIFKLGRDHPVEFELPEGIKVEVEDRPPRLSVSGIDKVLVGQVAADIRSLQPPEPYKGKGIKYAGEYIRRKAGKSAG